MKRYIDISKITFQDYAFFKGVELAEAKWKFAEIINGPSAKYATKAQIKAKNLKGYSEITESGTPCIPAKETLHKSKFDFSMISNSNLDGKCQMEYLCNYYNSGVPIQLLREFAENVGYKKALRFTGKRTIVNDILNEDQLKKLHQTWLFSNCYEVKFWSKAAIEFIESNVWARGYLIERGISEDIITDQINRVKNPEPKAETVQ